MAAFSRSLLLSGILSAFSVICTVESLPKLFIIGDSLVDSGNNNYITSISHGNQVPNGIDFIPSGRTPTGRYANGKTLVDLIADEFGAACYPPPFLGPNALEAAELCGNNYASGGAGILNKTGYVFIGRINMAAQVDNFANTRQQLIDKLGKDEATKLIKAAVFPIIMGSNDFLDNYLLPLVGSQKWTPLETFIEQVISKYREQVTRMYSLDARRFLVVNIGPVGCIPFQKMVYKLSVDECREETNRPIRRFNERLKDLAINHLSRELPESNFVYANVYQAFSDVLRDSARYGFKVKDRGCCKFADVGPVVQAFYPCGEGCSYCPDRTKYVFWDSYHPSQYTNELIVGKLMDGGSEYMNPYNLRRAIELYGF